MPIQKSDFDSWYVRQVDLLLKILPIVAKESCFAIKGGTAINLFLRDLPRLSVDIDLVYLPLENRETSLINIEKALLNIKQEIIRRLQGMTVIEKHISNPRRLSKLIVGDQEKIKIEPNEILRGTLLPPEKRDLSSAVENLFEQSVIDVPIATRSQLLRDILTQLTEKEKQFLLSIKIGKPDYTLMPYLHLDQLPALRWKLLNIQKIDQVKQRKMVDELEKLLYVGGA